MRRQRLYKDRERFHPVRWIIAIIVVSITLSTVPVLSFSDEIGQADSRIRKAAMEKLAMGVLESKSSLLRYEKSGRAQGERSVIRLMTEYSHLQEYTLQQNGSGKDFYDGYQEFALDGSKYDEILKENEKAAFDKVSNESKNGKKEAQEKNIIHFYDITEGKLPTEYILTNGNAFDDGGYEVYMASTGKLKGEFQSARLSVGVLDGDLHSGVEVEDTTRLGEGSAIETFQSHARINYTLEQLKDTKFLMQNFYIVDADTRVIDGLIDGEILLGEDVTIKQQNDKPQILIYHTHGQEAYIDSRPGETEDTVIGVGNYLAKILEEEYGYNVIHDTGIYDSIAGRSKAYDYSENAVKKILKENPSIEVLIDLHRDGANKRSAIIDGKETAQIMLFNGLSYNTNGPIEYLENPYIQRNLAFSLQLQLKGNDKYPGLFYRNYLKSYRYNLHLRPKSVLIELGTHKNTLESARNAMAPFAEVLDEVLQGK